MVAAALIALEPTKMIKTKKTNFILIKETKLIEKLFVNESIQVAFIFFQCSISTHSHRLDDLAQYFSSDKIQIEQSIHWMRSLWQLQTQSTTET